VSSFLTNTFNLDITQNSRLDGIESTLPSYLQTQIFDNYKITLNSTLTSIINTNTSQDTSINNINNTLPSFLQTQTFDNYTEFNITVFQL
jgi:hypothetical protein